MYSIAKQGGAGDDAVVESDLGRFNVERVASKNKAPAALRARLQGQGATAGFTLVEVLIVLAIVGILVAIAVPVYDGYKERSRILKASADIGAIAVSIETYRVDNLEYPDSLKQIGKDKILDPWGRPYEYFNLQTAKGNGQARKDKKLSPLNSDFDLYSLGKDGDSKGPLNAKASRDDVVRALDGRFIGLATDFDP